MVATHDKEHNMLTKVTVNVGQQHIDNGEPNDSTECPIALALYDDGYIFTSVTEEMITFTVSGIGIERSKNYICEALPTEMEEFIENFDANKDVVPFTSTFLVEQV